MSPEEDRPLVHVDDLPCVLNVVQAQDLSTILELTPASRRVAVALAFSGLTPESWSRAAGMDRVQVHRWVRVRRHRYRLPYGAALRLATVLGQSADVLFKALA